MKNNVSVTMTSFFHLRQTDCVLLCVYLVKYDLIPAADAKERTRSRRRKGTGSCVCVCLFVCVCSMCSTPKKATGQLGIETGLLFMLHLSGSPLVLFAESVSACARPSCSTSHPDGYGGMLLYS